MTKFISYGRQCVDEDDIKAVSEILKSDWITQGPKVKEFEDLLCRYTGARYAVVVSSGTAALHISCLAAGIEKGDEVITSPITFVASANCVLYCGGEPVFADIQQETVNIDPEEIEKKVTRNTRAIIPIHFAGYPCDLKEIHHIAKKRNLIVIEDACHALGAAYKCNGKWLKIGSCKHSDMTVFSFHPVKHITTGEGGAVTTDSKRLYEKLKALRNHGIYKDKTTAQKGSWYYEMRELGFNYRITNFQSALGISQLNKIDKFLRKRRELTDVYNKAFDDLSGFVKLPLFNDENKRHARHLYILRLNLKKLKQDRKYVFEKLRSRQIGVQVHYIPVYKQPYYQKNGYKGFILKNAEKYYQECISLPLYVSLSNDEQQYVIKAVKNLLRDYSIKG